MASFIGLAKLDINNNLAKGASYFDMYVFSGLDYPKIEIEQTKDMEKIEYLRYDILLNDKDFQTKGYLHQMVVYFFQKPVYLTKLAFVASGQSRNWSIGRYSADVYRPSCEQISSNVVVTKETENPDFYQLMLLVHNQDTRTFYLNAMETVAKQTSHNLTIAAFPVNQSQIPPTNVQVYQNLRLEFLPKYFQVENIIKLDFFTNLKQEYLYANYYVSRIPQLQLLQTTGINIQLLDHVSFNN